MRYYTLELNAIRQAIKDTLMRKEVCGHGVDYMLTADDAEDLMEMLRQNLPSRTIFDDDHK